MGAAGDRTTAIIKVVAMMELEKAGIITLPALAAAMGLSLSYVASLRRLRKKHFPSLNPATTSVRPRPHVAPKQKGRPRVDRTLALRQLELLICIGVKSRNEQARDLGVSLSSLSRLHALLAAKETPARHPQDREEAEIQSIQDDYDWIDENVDDYNLVFSSI